MPNPLIQAIIQGAPVQVGLEGAPIRIEMKAPQGPAGAAGPNSVTSTTTTNFTAGNVLSSNGTTVTSLSRSGIDTRTSFPNTDVTNATTTGAADQLLRLNAGGNAVANAFIATEGVEAGEEGGDSGYLRIINTSGDAVTINNANASNAEVSLPTGSGTLALTSSADGSLSSTDITDFVTAVEAAAPNEVTSATTSDGTANLSLSNVTTATATVTGTLNASHIHGNIAGSVYAHVRAGEALTKGDPVYVSGSHGTGANLIPIVSKADASNAAKMPAIGIMDADLANNANGHMVINGTIIDLDTNAYNVNQELYVAVGGGLTSTPPSVRAQPVARVERKNINNGAIIVKVNGLSASDATANTLVRRTSDGSATFTDLNSTYLTSGYVGLKNGVGSNALQITSAGITADDSFAITLNADYSIISVSGEGSNLSFNSAGNFIQFSGDSSYLYMSGLGCAIYTIGGSSPIYTAGSDSIIETTGENSHIRTVSYTSNIESAGYLKLQSYLAGYPDAGTQGGKLSIGTEYGVSDWQVNFPPDGGILALRSDLPVIDPNLDAFLETPTADNLRLGVTNDTGTGNLVFSNGCTLQPSIETVAATLTGGTEFQSPPICMFDDFFGITVIGNYPWTSTATSGRGSLTQGNTGYRGRSMGVARLVTGTVQNDVRFYYMFMGQHQDVVGTVWRADFAIPSLTDVQIAIGGGISATVRYALLFDSSLDPTKWYIATDTTNTVVSGTYAAPASGNFETGTRYRMFLSQTSLTTAYLKLQSASWNSATWTTRIDTTITHPSYNNTNWGVCSPYMFVQTRSAAAVAKEIRCDWIAVNIPTIIR